MRERGWIEGRNLEIESRWAEGRPDRYADLTADLIAKKVEVIVALGATSATQAAKEKTQTIPIVMVGVSNPIEAGFIQSFARPGGNITGLSNLLGDVLGKWIEVLREVRPDLRRVALFWEPSNAGSVQGFKDLEAMASDHGFAALSLPVASHADVRAGFMRMTQDRPDALIVHGTPIVASRHREIAEFAIAHGIPTITGLNAYVRGGLLISYGPEWASHWRRAADYVDRLLRGAKAAELPVEQPVQLELTLNMKTARASKIELPASLIARAGEVIE